MRKLLLAATLLLVARDLRAARLASGDFLNIPVDVRTLGMAEAGQATAAGAAGASVNPAAVSTIDGHHVYFTHAFLTTGIDMNYLAYGASYGKHHFGLSVQHVGYGELEGRDNAGNPTGSFGPSDDAYAFTYGTDVGRVETAATARWVRSEIVDAASALTFDLGGQLEIGDDWLVGLSGRNLGGKLEFESESAPLPTTVAGGVGWRAVPGWWLALDVAKPIYGESFVALGTEYAVPFAGKQGSLAFRLGLNTKTPDLGAFSGLKTGFGVRYAALDFDYAFSPYGGLGNVHHLSMGWRFGPPSNHRFDD